MGTGRCTGAGVATPIVRSPHLSFTASTRDANQTHSISDSCDRWDGQGCTWAGVATPIVHSPYRQHQGRESNVLYFRQL